MSPTATWTRTHFLATAARAALWMVVGLWLVTLMSWAVLHIWIVPRIGEFRLRLESAATQAVGVPVRVGQITAGSPGLMPSFELRDVVLLDPQGREALRLPLVLAAVSPSSLFNFGFEQLVIDQPTLDIRRTLDGKIYIGGLDVSATSSAGGDVAHWFFSQSEFVIRGGSIRWTDEQAAAPPLALQRVDAVMRNGPRRHAMRIDATPPAGWGERFSLRGLFRQPLLALDAGRWQDWSGQLFADFSRVDVSQIKPYVRLDPLGIAPRSGSGSVRAWADVDRGEVVGATADVVLSNVDVQLGKSLQPLALVSAAGRLGARLLADGFEVDTEGLTFTTQDGLTWPGGNLAYRSQGTAGSAGKALQTGELKADRLDLAALAQVALRLPLGTATHAALTSYAPKGVVQALQASWQIPVDSGLGQSRGTASAAGAAEAAGAAGVAGVAGARSGINNTGVTFTAKGRVSALELLALPSTVLRSLAQPGTASSASAATATRYPQVRHALPGRPGIKGAALDFDMTQAGGKAALVLNQGHIDLPGVFEDPRVEFDQLSADVQWKLQSNKTDVALQNIKFSSPDAQGTAQATWQSGVTAAGAADKQSLGTLDLEGVLARGNGARVHRYLPLVMADQVRHYVRDAVVQGDLSNVTFTVKGAVDDIPYANYANSANYPSNASSAPAKKGTFKIAALVKNGVLAYVPKWAQPQATGQWPALTALNGELVFDQATLAVNNATSAVAGLGGLQVLRADAKIPNLMSGATVELQAKLKGPVSSAIGFVNTSPLAAMTGNAAEKVTASGVGDYALELSLPLNNIDKTTVRGTVSLPGNDVRLAPGVPLLSRLRGLGTFTEKGFAIPGAQAQWLGGDVRFEGGMRAPARGTGTDPENEASVVFRAQGTASAEAIAQTRQWGAASRLAQYASGTAAYTATLGVIRGATELVLTSNLQGMALTLPAPLAKSAEALLPTRFEKTVLRESMAVGQKLQDRLTLDVGRIASAAYVRDISGGVVNSGGVVLNGDVAVNGGAVDSPRVVRGSIGVGLEPGESAPLPESGVAANINLQAINIDAWDKVLSSSQGEGAAGAGNAASVMTGTTARGGPAAGAQSYFPTQIAIRARELTVSNRKFNNLVIGGTRDGTTWRANMDASELNGYAEYRQAGSGSPARVLARLQRLSLGPSGAMDVDKLLDEQPANLPALDIVVNDLELRGKKLGRIEIDAVNRLTSGAAVAGMPLTSTSTAATSSPASSNESAAREWRLNKFNVITPEATLTATGNWVAINAQAAGGANAADRRRTALNFKLDINDSGELLNRFGMPGVVRRGKGKMEGQVGWVGSPLSPNYPSMSGQFNVNIESGQFLKADPGIAKLLGVLSLQSLPRRLTLDFRDVFSDGFAFDFVRGDVNIAQGIAATNNLQMKGVNAAVLMEGSANIASETQDLKVLVVPEINAGTASLIAAVINPAIGIGTFLAQYFLRQPLIDAATQEFKIDGSWSDPKVTKLERRR